MSGRGWSEGGSIATLRGLDDQGIGLVVAPVGSGKTTLLRQATSVPVA